MIDVNERATKRVFTKLYIEPLYKRLNDSVTKVEYVVATPSNEEYIIIWYESGFRKQLCVTADSLKAMILDTLMKA